MHMERWVNKGEREDWGNKRTELFCVFCKVHNTVNIRNTSILQYYQPPVQ